jgi:hypothetical protein
VRGGYRLYNNGALSLNGGQVAAVGRVDEADFTTQERPEGTHEGLSE